MLSDNEQPHQELVKCVVVGDTAVGKTRLICARACNKQVSLSQLLTTHVPTVWAIDQYRIYKDVLERSWDVVDGVNVSLRLWDTFGDHEKDRRFAYGRSDVVLLCFSLTNVISLRNCKAMWYPEIRRFCPNTPIILVGCKNDLRFMYRDDSYLAFFRDRSPFVRPTRKTDLIMPDEARSIAKDLGGIPYYETSVLTYHGVNDVFENAIRIALIARRAQRFWMTNLKKVQMPLLQVPYCPPKPVPLEITVQVSSYHDHLQYLYRQQAFTDVIFIVGTSPSVGFTAHRFVLLAACSTFQNILIDSESESSNEICRSASESSMVSTFGEATLAEFNEDTEYLIRSNDKSNRITDQSQLKRRSSCQALSSNNINRSDRQKRNLTNREINHPAITSFRLQQCEGLDNKGNKTTSLQTVITLSKLITAQSFKQILHYFYTGNIDVRCCDIMNMNLLSEVRQSAEFLNIPELIVLISNIQTRQDYLNIELVQRNKMNFRHHMRDLCLAQGLFSDVLFQLDDGLFASHRSLLMARCDMFKAMFSGDFREGFAKVIIFPGVKSDTFNILLNFIYTDDLASNLIINPNKCIDILELANRLCLQRMTNLIEKKVIEQMKLCDSNELIQICLKLLEPSKLHNADQLASWCMTHLCVNYNKLCKMSSKLLKGLHIENQEYLIENRWPPVWYLKDRDYYEKCKQEREKEEKILFKRNNKNSSGCLCFQKQSTTTTSTTITTNALSNDIHVVTSQSTSHIT